MTETTKYRAYHQPYYRWVGLPFLLFLAGLTYELSQKTNSAAVAVIVIGCGLVSAISLTIALVKSIRTRLYNQKLFTKKIEKQYNVEIIENIIWGQPERIVNKNPVYQIIIKKEINKTEIWEIKVDKKTGVTKLLNKNNNPSLVT